MSNLLLMNVGAGLAGTPAATSSSSADPQLQYFENIPGKDLFQIGVSFATLSVHAVNIPLSVSFNNLAVLGQGLIATGSVTMHFGLYSLNGGTLSLANSASGSATYESTSPQWISFATSATQNISPGAWYFAVNKPGDNVSQLILHGNSSGGPLNAQPVFIRGRMTVSTAAMPATIATSELDITGSDASRQPYVIITA